MEEVQSVEMLHEELEKRDKNEKEKKSRENGNQNLYEELMVDIKQKKKNQGKSAVNRNWINEKIYWKTGKKNIETDKKAKKKKQQQSTVSPTTKWRYLEDLKARAQKALWFLRAYGLKLNSCEVEVRVQLIILI